MNRSDCHDAKKLDSRGQRRSCAAWPPFNTRLHLHVARYNKFQACRYGFAALLSDPVGQQQKALKESLGELLELLAEDARALACSLWLERLGVVLKTGYSDADWLRGRQAMHMNLNDVVRDASLRLRNETVIDPRGDKR